MQVGRNIGQGNLSLLFNSSVLNSSEQAVIRSLFAIILTYLN